MRKPILFLFTLALIAGPAGAQQHIHKTEFKKKLYFKGALIKTGIAAVWGTARNSPHEWGRTIGGFGKRAGSSYAQRAIKGVVEFGVSEVWTHEDLRYRKSEKHGFFPRVEYALVRTFWVPRDVGGGNTFAAGRVSGAFIAGQVARTWMPHRVATFGAGASSAGLSLGLDAGLNVVREFWPKKRR
jgi:hypothetical protein